jgi:hypothetical protein
MIAFLRRHLLLVSYDLPSQAGELSLVPYLEYAFK